MTSDDRLSLFEKLLATNPNVERKGDTIPYSSLNGHMDCDLSTDGFVALRLPAGIREEFLEKYKTTLVTAYGIIQKEYVTVPDPLLKKTNELKHYFDISYDYISKLKPKPTAKSKKKG